MRKYTKMHILFKNTGSTLSIDLATNQVENWLFDEDVSTDCKTSDECLIKFEQRGTIELFTYSGYVPDCFPGKHYGDYIMLEINAKGIVQDLKITDENIEQLLKEMEEGYVYE